jgi:hypothetical protein
MRTTRSGAGRRHGVVGAGFAENRVRAQEVRLLTRRAVADLGTRPFEPTAAQLAAVAGPDLGTAGSDGPEARAAAGRYAFLFAAHAVPDITVPNAAGMYAELWLCARRAFLDQRPDAQGARRAALDTWQNEGGASAPSPHADVEILR